MKNLILILLIMTFNTELTIFNFNKDTDINEWYQTNDDVMGGISNSKMSLNNYGNAVFSGRVSTANNGGFAMTRLPVNISVDDSKSKIVIKLKGDGKKYQFRVKSKNNQRFWYVHTFLAPNEMKEIEIALKDFYPSFRGYKLDIGNFNSSTISEVAILIGNKKNEEFKLEIDKITIR